MKFSIEIKNQLLNADSKALATSSKEEVNVVPISTVYIIDEKIYLVDYFFNKTRDNFIFNSNVSLVFWSGFCGYQIKANSVYETEGKDFDLINNQVSENYENRVVKGILILEPKKIYNISI